MVIMDNHYIFPIAEIEYHILSFLDPILDIPRLLTLNKYYYHLFINEKFFSQLYSFYKGNNIGRDCVSDFIEAYSNKNYVAKILYLKFEYRDDMIVSALKNACINDNLDIIKWLCRKKETSFHNFLYKIIKVTCKNNKFIIFDWICNTFPDESVTIVCKSFYEFLRYTCLNNSLKIAKRIYQMKNKNDKNFNNYYIESVLKDACIKGNLKFIM